MARERKEQEQDEPRARPYVYASWPTKAIAKEVRCAFQLWFKAHYAYKKTANERCKACTEGRVPCDDPEVCRADFFKKFNEKHDALVADRVERLQAEGWTVRTEDEAKFSMKGKLGDMTGKPDIVAMRGDEALVIDAKSGNPRESDHWQVLIYILALPRTWLRGFKTIRGQVEYTNGSVPVRPLGDKERARIGEVVRTAMEPTPPEPTPSLKDCRYCDIASCDARYDAEHTGDAGGLF